MDYIKIFAKNEKLLEIPMKTIIINNQDLGMKIGNE